MTHSRVSMLAPLTVWSLSVACGSDAQHPPADVASTSPDTARDEPAVDATVPDDTGRETPMDDDTSVPDDTQDATQAAFGAPCTSNGDCFEGACVPGPDGLFCSRACGDCPTDYACSLLASPFDATFCMPHAWCPPTPPTPGSACKRDFMSCLYGTDPSPACREDYTCRNSKWQHETWTNSACGWIACPATQPGATERCEDDPNTAGGCWYGGTYCACEYGGTFRCYAPISTPGCPETVPNWGARCEVPGLECKYCKFKLVCDNGEWVEWSASGKACEAP